MTATLSTVPHPDAGDDIGDQPRPRTVLHIETARAALRAITGQILGRYAGGPVIDATHPLASHLVPYAAQLQAWLVSDGPRLTGDLRRLAASTVRIVEITDQVRALDDDAADILIVPGLSRRYPGTPVLLDLTRGAAERPFPDRGQGAGLLGDFQDLPGTEPELTAALGQVRGFLTQWRAAGNRTRPEVLLRTKVPGAAARAITALANSSARAPVVRLDVSGLAAGIAASTVIHPLRRVARVGIVETEVLMDMLPPTGQPARVVNARLDRRTRVLMRQGSRAMLTEIIGWPWTVGSELITPGWHPTACDTIEVRR